MATPIPILKSTIATCKIKHWNITKSYREGQAKNQNRNLKKINKIHYARRETNNNKYTKHLDFTVVTSILSGCVRSSKMAVVGKGPGRRRQQSSRGRVAVGKCRGYVNVIPQSTTLRVAQDGLASHSLAKQGQPQPLAPEPHEACLDLSHLSYRTVPTTTSFLNR
jgi:hypothetical protein